MNQQRTSALTKSEFLVLRAYARAAGLPAQAMAQVQAPTQRDIAVDTGLSLGTVSSACKSLAASGLVHEGRITDQGIQALEPYRVHNAIIMAAGLSSRFAPVSYEKPKGLLNVRGEVLIERQINQLHEVGITDIVVVVGYKKEYFFYLEEQFGARIVVNPEFASRNNNSTLMRVVEDLGNTYICSSDNYFTENPFQTYMYKAAYSAEYSQGTSKEWCLTIGAKDRITAVTVGGQDAWYMIGPAYFDQEFSARFASILKAEYDNPRTFDMLWEQLYLEHIDQLDMEICRFAPGVINEFDSIDELKEFDPLFLENLDSDIFDNIVAVLGCEKSDIHDVYPLKKGLTNLSCHFRTKDGEYVYRHPGVGTEEMINRSAEVEAQQVAKSLGIDDTFIFENPQRGWKISRFIPNARQLDPHDPVQLRRAMETARSLHSQDARVSRSFDFYQEGKSYEALLRKNGPIDVPGYQEMATDAQTVRAFAQRDGFATCLTHNDFFDLNLLLDEEDKLYLIDWEYAGMSDAASDFGTFVVTCQLSDDEAYRALEYYYGRTPTDTEVRHNYAYVGLAGWCWYVWALQKESCGDYVGEWLYIYYNYAKTYLAKALELYRKAEGVK